MTWLLIICYLALHFTLFVLIFRHQPRFRTEGGVFLLHVVSAVALFAVMLVWFALSPSHTRLALAIGAAAAHGIYSLSFLEIWALSDGGYSLRVLAAVVSRGQSTVTELEAHFTALSSGKKEGRLDSLLELGLVTKDGNAYALTPRGKVVAKFIAGIGYLAQLEKTG
jgi:hypothetical protein